MLTSSDRSPMILFHSPPQGGEELTVTLIAGEEIALTLCDIPGHFDVVVECVYNRKDVWKRYQVGTVIAQAVRSLGAVNPAKW
jgi:hypothetical protein